MTEQELQPNQTLAEPTAQPPKTRYKRVILLVILLFIVLAVALIVGNGWNNKAGAPSSPQNTAKQAATINCSSTSASDPAQVEITKTGIAPGEIMVAPCQQVTWTNNDTKPHSLIADPSAKENTYTDVPSPVLEAGESMTVRMEKKGLYVYYDKANPAQFHGKVTVAEDIQQPASN